MMWRDAESEWHFISNLGCLLARPVIMVLMDIMLASDGVWQLRDLIRIRPNQGFYSSVNFTYNESRHWTESPAISHCPNLKLTNLCPKVSRLIPQLQDDWGNYIICYISPLNKQNLSKKKDVFRIFYIFYADVIEWKISDPHSPSGASIPTCPDIHFTPAISCFSIQRV